MSETRLRILSVSRVLFNEKGYSNVTIRMIALKLKMSSGNLNYHFKKREDILEALYFEMVEVFDIRIKKLNHKNITLKTVKDDVTLSLKRMTIYRFFWTDLYTILRLNSKIKSHFKNAYEKRFKGYELLFEILNKKDVLRDFQFNKERFFLIERMINFSNTWLYNSVIYNLEVDNDYLELQTKNLLGMLYPYFTDLGKSQYKNIFPEYFE